MNAYSEPLNSVLSPREVINLDAYPIEDPGSAAFDALVKGFRTQLDEQQYVVLPDFIRPAARQQAVRQIENTIHLANHNCSDRNCYLQRKPDPALPADHPRNILLSASTWMLGANLLPAESPLKTLYYWENMMRMVAGIVSSDTLYFNEDDFQPVNALCYKEGDRSSWHFDSVNAFTMTLMLQAPEKGGDFEIIPNIRTDNDQRYEAVGRALTGNGSDVVRVGREEGALCIFRGCNSLHRVSEVYGSRLRMMGVFVYENMPGVKGDPEVNETVYGSSSISQATVPA